MTVRRPPAAARAWRRLATVGLLLGAVLTLASAPVGALSDPEAWGETFCTETVGWLDGATAGANNLSAEASDPNLTPAQGKALLVDFLGTGVDATGSFASEVKSVGAPNITNGQKIQVVILAGIAGSGAKLAALEKAAKALPTKSVARFAKGATKITQQVESFAEPFQKGLSAADKLDKDGELSDVLSSLPACEPLANGAAG